MMKIKNILPALLVIGSAYAATSCIEDESEYGGNPIPGLTVTTTATAPDQMPEVNFNYGEECVITPQVNYDGSGTLTYEWSVGSYDNDVMGELEVVSNEKTLRYSFPAGGSYYAHLKVTDGTVGVAQDYRVNINRTFEQGYILVSSDLEGYGNLAFIKDLTAEDREQGITSIVMEHCVERVNENVKKEKLAGITVLRLSWPSDITRIVATYSSVSYFLDPNTFMSISTINHDNVIPGFKGDMVIAEADVTVYDATTGRYLTLLGADMMGVEKEGEYSGFTFDVYTFATYFQWGTQNYEYYFANRSPMSISFVSYTGVATSDDLVDENNTPLFMGHSLNNILVGEVATYNVDYMGMAYPVEYRPALAISRHDATGKYYLTRFRQDAPYGATASLLYMSRGEIPTNANTAIPNVESCFAVSETYHRTYYACGNSIYVMLSNGDSVSWPDKSQHALKYPDNEEITYMTINTDTNELIVATADKTTGRGNVYFYDVANVRTDSQDTPAKLEYRDCADRISYIVYKPRVANSNS